MEKPKINHAISMIDIDSVIEDFNKIDDISFEKVKGFQSAVFKHKRYLLGRNQHSATLIKIFDIDGVITPDCHNIHHPVFCQLSSDGPEIYCRGLTLIYHYDQISCFIGPQ